MVGASNQHVFLIQIDASSFAELDISEFELSRFDCTMIVTLSLTDVLLIELDQVFYIYSNPVIQKRKYVNMTV